MIFKTLKFILNAEHPHFLSVDKTLYFRWKWIIQLAVSLNNRYRGCEIFRKKYKTLNNFVVIGLRYNGKNVKRRTSGFAKDFIEENIDANCIYCDRKLNNENATADHIIPISNGGNNSQVNLVVCCKECNNERGNIDFKKYLYFKNKNIKHNKYFI